MSYLADVRDVKFNFFEWLDLDRLLKADRFSAFGRDDLEMILDEAHKVSSQELAACNEDGDRIGAQYADGKVTMPPGFKEAYNQILEGGWIGATAGDEFGGMGLMQCMGTAIMEFMMGANVALSLTPMLGRGVSHLLERFGTPEMQKLMCEKLATGEWAGTMCLTEAGAGSDVGASKAKAVKRDGKYYLSGEKVFITSGEHDLTPNIIHAVLARTPDSPPGTKGLSLFIIPKYKINPDGSLGEQNDIRCEKIEEKMGIHGSPTCVMLFGPEDKCEAWLLGEEHQGMAIMFTMMNQARYEVGLQGLAIGSAAHQAALAYARERLQGRHYLERNPAAEQVPIVEHPDVRRMLLHQESLVMAMRALLSYTAFCMDMAEISEGDEQQHYQAQVELLTPICKAWCSDRGYEVADSAMQCYGGYGYTREFPAEQYVRDVKIAAIYEGTNGIQALDLVGRKFRAYNGEPVKRFITAAGKTAKQLAEDKVLGPSAKLLDQAVQILGETALTLAGRHDALQMVVLNAYPILEMFGDTFGGHLLLQQASKAGEKLQGILQEKRADASDDKALEAFLRDNPEAAFYHNKIQAAVYYAHHILPRVEARGEAIKQGDLSPLKAIY